MNFSNPSILFHFYWMIPGIIVICYMGRQIRKKRLHSFISGDRLATLLTENVSFIKRRVRDTLFLLGFLFLLIAFAGPHWGTTLVERPAHSRDIMVVIDTSRSMLATDVAPSRLHHAKWFIRNTIHRSPNDRYGLIAFSGTAFLECPLTQDKDGFCLFLDDIDTATIPVGGTNLESALEEAGKAFKAAEGRHRAILLLTDGEEVQGDVTKVTQRLKEKNIPIYVVGIGDSVLGSFIQLEDNTFITDEQGNRVRTKLNENALRKIAASVGGIYVHSTVTSDHVDDVAQKIQGLIPENREDNTVFKPMERYQLPLCIGFLLLLARMLLGEKKRMFKAAKLASIIFLLVGSIPDILQAEQNNILEEDTEFIYQEKEALAKKAIVSLQQQIDQEQAPLKKSYLYYNLGVNYHFLGQTQEAENAYQQALMLGKESRQLQGQAYQNLGVIQHNSAQKMVMATPKKALQKLSVAQEYYREAMREYPTQEDIAQNQEALLGDKKLIEEIIEAQEMIKNMQENAKENLQDSREKQEEANNTSDPEEKKQKQQEAMEKTANAEKMLGDMANEAREQGYDEIAKQIEKSQEMLEEAQNYQRQAMEPSEEIGKESNSSSSEHGKEAEKRILQAMQALGIKEAEDTSEKNQETVSDNGKTSEEKESSQEGEGQGEENTAMTSLPEKNKPPGDGDNKAGNKNNESQTGSLSALRILDEMQQREKDWKNTMKTMQQQESQRQKKTIKNW